MKAFNYTPQGSIYKYTSVDGAMATLNGRTLKFECPLNFNDPFDCNPSILEFTRTQSSTDELAHAITLAKLTSEQREMWEFVLREHDGTFQDIYQFVVKQKIEKSKVTCFSKNYVNTVMWAHYAEHHKGVCLEFNGSMDQDIILDRGSAMILNVNYDKNELIDYNQDKELAIVDLFTRKSSDWRYEEEVRIIIKDENNYQKFNKGFLTGIIFGCRCSNESSQSIIEVLSNVGFSVPLQRAVKGDFDLTFEPIYL